ncbi:MAG: peptidoglycan editing factor PgeF [Lachnospiraceae bacterium]|nr:peptidoglycan editing factor PgeF [Lachnospiraceae bacterium]
MNLEENNGIKYLTFDLLKNEDVKYGFSTRIGGVSTGVYDSLNFGFNRGDSDENVKENYRRMAKALNMNYERMCLSKQTHTTNVRVVTEKDAGNGILRPLPYDDVDGLITNVPDLPLVTFFADCIPLVLFDPKKRVIAAAHSGWRGTVGKIGKVTIEKMKESFSCDTKDILCCIAPGICKDCYEVSSDVAEEFKSAFGKDVAEEMLLRPSLFHPGDKEKYMLDLWKACKLVFLEAKIPKEHIEVTDYCTRCHPKLFYSHRVMGVNRGNLASFISL